MATKKKLLQAAAGQAGGAALNVEDVFSTYLYEGNGTARSITNGIDVSGEGGLVWIKTRETATYSNNMLYDTENGANYFLRTNGTNALTTASGFGLTAFNSDGFSMGIAYGNESGIDTASWTFRKAPKFFDVVTYTGNGTAGRTVSHNLGSVPGCIIVKATNTAKSWPVYHRGADATAPEDKYLFLNFTSAAQDNSVYWNDTAPTSTEFTVGTDSSTNGNGNTYVAYLFAHNNGDGEFGSTADQDVIKCGSYTGNGSTPVEINLGFEPQFIIQKDADSSGDNWRMHDVMRGWDNTSRQLLNPNQTAAESPVSNTGGYQLIPTATGFYSTGHTAGNNHIYIAIRRGPMAVPESATDVFDMSYATDANDASFPVDFMLSKIMAGGNGYARDRLRGGTKYLLTDGTFADLTGTDIEFDDMTGTGLAGWGTSFIHYNWRRAPNFFDVVAYTGTGSNQTISHNLGVAPKFMIVKERTTPNNWPCYLEALGNDKRIGLNAASSVSTDTTAWQSTTPTDSAFYVGANSQTNASGENFIAYLFGEVAGISKFGTYTGTGAAQNIDCGFSSGARFVLIKTYAGTNPNANWNIWDSERGIIAGNDPYLALNSTAAEVTSTDVIDPYSSGFSLTSSGVANNSGTSYWFYAIA